MRIAPTVAEPAGSSELRERLLRRGDHADVDPQISGLSYPQLIVRIAEAAHRRIRATRRWCLDKLSTARDGLRENAAPGRPIGAASR